MKQKQWIAFLLGFLIVVLAACLAQPTPTPVPPTLEYQTPITLPTITPRPLDDPEIGQVKQLLKRAIQGRESQLLLNLMSIDRWVGAIYREGGTPPIDPVRGSKLTEQFAKENTVIVDTERPIYEPVWNNPVGETGAFASVINDKGEHFSAHLYIGSEPGGWRFTGILTRIPYYDAPSVAQLKANPTKYEGRELMLVGEYEPRASAPQAVGTAPGDEAFVLDTFSGPIWIARKNVDYAPALSTVSDADTGKLMRVFGVLTVKNGVPYLDSDSFKLVADNTWAHVRGKIEAVDASARTVKLAVEGTGTNRLRLAETAFISLPDGATGTLADVKAGITVDATGTPQKDGTLLVDEFFIAH